MTVRSLSLTASCVLLVLTGGAYGQEKIQDNSFLVEEAYNQERGIVQHISTFSRMWNSKDWTYTFTQEWPMPGDARHQLSYTLIGMHAGAFPGSGAGLGDVALNYRYQLVGNGESRLAFSPRLTALIPTGDTVNGRGLGASGVQVNLPVSVEVNSKLVTHWNAGATFVRHALSPDGDRANSVGYNLGQSFVYLANPRLNFLVETVMGNFQSVIGPGLTEWSKTFYVSPGVRWAHNFKNGLQIVPGLAMPIGIGPSAGEKGAFVYLSFEHPFTKAH